MKKHLLKLGPPIILLLLIGAAMGCHLWAHWHYRAAQRAVARRSFDEAQEHLAPCLRVWFWSAETRLLAARTARRAGEFDRAESYLSDCRQLGGPAETIDLEHTLLRARQGELPSLEGYLLQCVRDNHPDSALILEALSREYLRTYQLTRARHCLDQWLKREPAASQAWLWQAEVCARLGDRPGTLQSCRRLVELDPEDDQSRLKLAGLLIGDSAAREALAHYEYLHDRQRELPAVLLGLARCRRTLGQPEEARQLLDRLLADQGDNSLALVERGKVALDLEKLAEAEKWFRRAVAVAPFEKEVNYAYYLFLERLGKRREAEEVLTKLKRTEADLQRLREVTHAIADRPHDPALRHEAGLLLMRNGQETEGARWLESALQQDPFHTPSHQALADYHARSGNQDRAAKHRRLALLTESKLPTVPNK